MEKTVSDLARWLEGRAEGDVNRKILGVAALESAGDSDISFLESTRNLPQALESQAGCLLAPSGLNLPGKTVIRVHNPRYCFARVLELFFSPPPLRPGVHRTAQIGYGVKVTDETEVGPQVVIGDWVKIGARSSIGTGCVLGDHAVLGDDCVLYPHVTLYPGVQLGSRVILHSGCVVGSDGFGYALEAGRYYKLLQNGSVEIADDVEVGANSTIDRGTLGATRIGRGTKIDNLVHIGHNVQIGENCVIAAQTGISGSVVIEDNVVIAGQVGIGDHVRVQKGAVLGGQCGILPHKKVRAGQTVWGTPARPLREVLEQMAFLSRLSRRSEPVEPQGKRRPPEPEPRT